MCFEKYDILYCIQRESERGGFREERGGVAICSHNEFHSFS